MVVHYASLRTIARCSGEILDIAGITPEDLTALVVNDFFEEKIPPRTANPPKIVRPERFRKFFREVFVPSRIMMNM